MEKTKVARRGIILAGGKGTRLHPLTKAISKQLLPVYRQPMIYYPLATLKSMGVTEILIITTPEQQNLFINALTDVDPDLKLDFAIQEEPRGIAQALLIAERWLDGSDVILILGDNIFIYTGDIEIPKNNTIYTYSVKNPAAYGVVSLKADGRIDRIVEKPLTFVSDQSVVGLYALSNHACSIAHKLRPSQRNELEIVDLIRELDRVEPFTVKELNGFWFDAGTIDDLHECSDLVKAIETRTGKPLGLI